MRPIKKLQSTMRTIQLNNFLPFDQEKDIQDVPTLSDVGCSDYDGLNGRDEISELASTFNHMTKRLKEAQKQLVQDKSRLHDTIENAMDAVVQMNTAGFITGWTKHAEIIFGWSREEALGRALHETIIPQQYREGHVQGLQRYLHSGKGTILNSRIEVIGLHRDGSEFPIELSITTITSGDRHEFSAFIRDISERKLAEEEVQRLAFYDPLTLLPNRRLLMDRLQHALANSARSGNSGALLFIDLDHFKTLNDTLGHDIGDLLLQQVGQRLESCLREGDTVARLGGDEFVVLLEELSQKTLEAAAQVETIGEKMLTALNHPYQLGTYKHHNTPSIGAALFSDHESELDELFKKADIAMYQAKKAGRNTIRFFDPKIQETINARAALEEELREALEKQQFHLYYQIQMDGLNQPLGAEVLIRWIHPERGMVSPVQFIPLAEETGLILPIGLWVLDTACAQIKVWEQHVSTRDLVMAVNVSARQFGQTNFVAQVQTIVQCHGINPTRLKLELTESMLVENIKGIISTMKTLKEMGIQFSLDDFGTGYSSLQYLQKLPLNQLKIDQSFVRDMPVDAGGGAIVQTIIAMAKGLNLDIIAEGVETEEQRQLLHSLGCDHYQGYLFSKPVPIEQFEALLTSHIKG
jgi:diguanylate cyclase (GGDEF)-like protein/PAS domain S-box-containing protein